MTLQELLNGTQMRALPGAQGGETKTNGGVIDDEILTAAEKNPHSKSD